MVRTFSSLRLFVVGTALLMAFLAAPVALARAGSAASFHWLAMAGEPAAPDQCTVWYNPGAIGGPIWVNWMDNSDNEDGFTIEWWWSKNKATKNNLVLQITYDSAPIVLPNYQGQLATRTAPRKGWNYYRVRAYNANGVSAWSNWAELIIK